LQAVAEGRSLDPFAVLGRHSTPSGDIVRVMLPGAFAVTVVARDERDRQSALNPIRQTGLFVGPAAGRGPYALRLDWGGLLQETEDPYSFGPLLGELDVYLLAEGKHHDLAACLGAHAMVVDGVPGVRFAVWAPNARRVSVVGDFNTWDGRRHPMRKLIGSGIWELFIPGIGENAHYKFEIRTGSGAIFLKSDPFAFFSQHGKETASLVYDLSRYRWADAAWMEARRSKNMPRRPLSIYEVHLGSWRRKAEEGNRFLSYLELADTLLPYVIEMGYTHIELMPMAEHPF